MPGSPKELEFLLIGERRTGKTSLLRRLCSLPSAPPSTQGFHTYAIHETACHQPANILITDTGGLDQVMVELFPYIDKAHALLIVYDTSRESTFKAVQYWLYFCYGPQSSYREKLIFLIGTVGGAMKREVRFEQGLGLAKEYGTWFLEMEVDSQNSAKPLFQMILQVAMRFQGKQKKR